MVTENWKPLVEMSECYLEIDDPRLSHENECYVDYFFHAQTLTATVTHLDGQLVETIRFPLNLPKNVIPIQERLGNWHKYLSYLVSTPSEGDGKKKNILHRADPQSEGDIKETSAVKPKIEPPWVTSPDLFGSWRPSLLNYEDYHLIEVMIDGEKCFVCWRNLSQSGLVIVEGSPLHGFELRRRDGSYLRIGRFPIEGVADPTTAEGCRYTKKVYSRLNPPGVAPDGPLYSRPHNIDEHLSRGKPNALESEYTVNSRAFAYRKLHGDFNLPLDDHGYPLVKGFIKSFEVYVDRNSYWKECYLSVSILNGMTIDLYRTNGTHELVQFTVTNEHVLKALGNMVSAWRELWPGQIPGFVCDLSSEWSAEPAVNWKNHWFDPSYGFENNMTGAEENKIGKRVPGGGIETTAHLSVREVSNGFGLSLTFGDGSRKVIHFHTADLMDGRNEISDFITVWNMLPSDRVGIVQTWPVLCEDSEIREDRVSWTIDFIKDRVGALSKLFTT